jgi:hypothetical protein
MSEKAREIYTSIVWDRTVLNQKIANIRREDYDSEAAYEADIQALKE